MAEARDKELLIRAYQPQDLPSLHALDACCFPPDIAFSRAELLFHVNHPDSITCIAELAGEIVGFVIGRFTKPASAHVLTLDVAPRVQRRGIGAALMRELHAELRHRGAEIAFLEVDVENSAARSFYEWLQYKYLEILPGYYNGRSDAFRMMRDLAASPASQP